MSPNSSSLVPNEEYLLEEGKGNELRGLGENRRCPNNEWYREFLEPRLRIISDNLMLQQGNDPKYTPKFYREYMQTIETQGNILAISNCKKPGNI
ncbi:hypothetical protein Trydic_g5140 [Trypoxylus dichotomus]